ncbi:hypothetical protein KAW80_03455 [Candidatus Babeliales bacterium]|nr:hypothetical protein [Candidatus Babeliales bacterium]
MVRLIKNKLLFSLIFSFLYGSNSNNIKDQFSQTETYIKAMPNIGFRGEYKKYKNLLSQVIEKEKLYSNDYYAFYHGQHYAFFTLYELQKRLTPHMNACDEFEFLRIESELDKKYNGVKEFLKKNKQSYLDTFGNWLELQWLCYPKLLPFPNTYSNLDDTEPDIQKILLSVNLSFPGNLRWGASAFCHFADSVSFASHSPFIKKIIKQFDPNFYKNYEYIPFIDEYNENKEVKFCDLIFSEILSLADIFEKAGESGGLLLQIFIHKDIVDKYVYMSKDLGKPEKTLSPSKVIEKKYKDTLTKAQARIILNRDLFSKPNKKIKICKYHRFTSESLKIHKKILDDIVDRLFQNIHSRQFDSKEKRQVWLDNAIKKSVMNINTLRKYTSS